jgi:GxxExxY protein
MAVHREIGPGQRERVYQRVLETALADAGLACVAQKNLPVYHDGQLLGFYIPDFVIEEKVIVEIKAFTSPLERYRGQVITYLNHSGLAIGLLVNFGQRSLDWRWVFPSPQSTTSCYSGRWLFVPDWLEAQRRGHNS